MINHLDNISSLTNLKRKAKECQKMSKNDEIYSIMRGIEAGLDSTEKGTSIPLEKAFAMLRKDIKTAAHL